MAVELVRTGYQYEVCFNGAKFDCSMVQSIKVSASQDENEVESLCGVAYTVYKTPKFEVDVTFTHRNVELMAALFPGYAVTSVGGKKSLVIGAATCGVTTGSPLNLHPTCDFTTTGVDQDAAQDWTFWNVTPKLDGDLLDITSDGSETFTVTFKASVAPATLSGGGVNPHAGQVVQVGANDMDTPQVFDCTAGDFVNV